MRRSDARILTTHVGSLPHLAALDRAAPDYPRRLEEEVAAVVSKQRQIGLDLVNEGEYTKEGDWLAYLEQRFDGFEARPRTGTPLIAQGKDREEFAEFYRYATERGTLFYLPGGQIRTQRPYMVCTGP